MAKIRLTGATFDASEKTVTHANFSDVTLSGIQLIVNVTDQIIIYNFADTTKGGTLSTDTLTLEYDTTSMSDTDELMILVEDGVASVAINDGGNTITVDGTVAVTNAGLTELAAAINGSSQMDVNIAANGIGLATSAKQDTIIGHVDGVETLLGTIDADTSNISTKIDTIAGAVSGTEMQVDVLSSALPTGASTSANQTTIIGHLDGVEGLLTTIAGDTTDIETAVELIDDTVQVLGTDTYSEATSKGITLGAVRRDADTTLVNTTNEFSPLQVDANGRLKVEVFSGEALPVTLTSTTITGTVAVTQSGTWDEVGINDSGNSITVDNAQLSVVGSGTEATALRVTIATDSTGVLSIDDNGGNISIDDGGNTITVDGTVAVTNAGLTELAAAINASSQVDVNIAASDIAFGGTSAADDADFSVGTTPGTPVMGVYDSTPDTVTDGDLGVIGINANRAVRTVVEGTVAVTQSGTWDEVGINDSGNSITVDAVNLDIRDLTNSDVVTAELSATDNAVLDAIAASVAAIDTDATTIIGHLDGVETLLGTIDADTSGIITSVQLLDDTVQVLGTDTYTETSSKGITLGAVRRDADTTLVGTTNEFAPLQVDANGRLKVEVFSGEALPVTLTSTTITGTVAVTQSGTWDEVGINDSGNSITVDNGGTFAVQSTLQAGTAYAGKLRLTDGTTDAEVVPLTGYNAQAVALVDGDGAHITSIGGGTEYAVDAALGANPTGKLALFKRDDALSALTPAEGDAVEGRVDANGNLWVSLGTKLDSTNDSITAELGATDNAVLDAIAASVASSDTSLTDIEAALETAGGLVVNLGANNDVTVTGTVDLGATDNAVLDDIAAKLGTIDTDTGNIDTSLNNIETYTLGKHITGIGHGVKTVTSAGTDEALAGSTACKRITIQAQTDNTGLIAVGGSGVDATVATGTGIILYPGDTYELETDNLADVFIDSTVSGDGVRYTYFT